MEFLFDLLVNYGVPYGLVVFFIWRDSCRENILTERTTKLEGKIETLERETRTILIELVNKTNNVLLMNAHAMKEWLEVFKSRPCLEDPTAKHVLDNTLKEIENYGKE